MCSFFCSMSVFLNTCCKTCDIPNCELYTLRNIKKSCIIFPRNGIMSYPCICLIAGHIHGTMYRVASICFCISQRCTSHRTMYMTCYKTYTWIRHDSVKWEDDM